MNSPAALRSRPCIRGATRRWVHPGPRSSAGSRDNDGKVPGEAPWERSRHRQRPGRGRTGIVIPLGSASSRRKLSGRVGFDLKSAKHLTRLWKCNSLCPKTFRPHPPSMLNTHTATSSHRGSRKNMSLLTTLLLTAFIRLKDATSPGRKASILGPLLHRGRSPLLPRPDPAKLPRIIWTYWAQGYENAPEIVRYCLASWKRHNPGWDVRFLTSETVRQYVDTGELEEIVSKAQYFDYHKAIYADLLRLKLLRTYGGVWADAALLCMYPLDTWLHTLMSGGVMMFQRPIEDCPVLNGFIAAQKEHPLIIRWQEMWEAYFRKHRLIKICYAFESYLRRFRSVQSYSTTHYILDFLIKFDRPTRRMFHAIPSLDARRLETLRKLLGSKNYCKTNVPNLTGIPMLTLTYKMDIDINDVEYILAHQPKGTAGEPG